MSEPAITPELNDAFARWAQAELTLRVLRNDQEYRQIVKHVAEMA